MQSVFLILLMLLPARPADAAAPPARERVSAQILSAAYRVLAARFPQDRHRLKVRLVRTGGALEDTGEVRLGFPAEEALPRAHTQVDVLTRRGGTWRKAGWALLYIAHFDSVMIARRRLAAGVPLRRGDVHAAWIETTAFRGTPLRPADVRTMAQDGPVLSARPVREGDALRRTDVRPPYAAATGEPVVMTYRRGPFQLRLPCKAREPGMAGAVIRLYAPATGRMYRARLTGKGTAEWVETL